MSAKDFELVTKTYRAPSQKVEEASERAKKDGKTLSEVVRIFITDYAEGKLDLPGRIYF